MSFIIRLNLPTPVYYQAQCYGFWQGVYQTHAATQFPTREAAASRLRDILPLHCTHDILERRGKKSANPCETCAGSKRNSATWPCIFEDKTSPADLVDDKGISVFCEEKKMFLEEQK